MTTEPRRRVRSVLAASAVVVLLAGGALALAQSKGREKGVKPVSRPEASWSAVDRLVGEQKYEDAAREAEKILASAKAKGNEADWTKALVTVTQLRIGLHGYETAVRRLREESWPTGPISRAQLSLLYGHSLVTYQRAYSWEIGQRERVEAKGEVDLKAWTREQILTEALKAALEVWNARDALGKEPASAASLVLETNDYPKEIRGTLRDAVSYLLVDLLADTAGWTPEQSNEVWRLDLGALLSGNAAADAKVDLASPAVHPLVKIGAALSDLESWHAGAGRQEAQLEARLERVRRLSASFSDETARVRIRKDLESRLPAFRQFPWWAMGKAEVAALHQASDRPNRRVDARREAEEGRAAYPSSVGGARCLSIVKAIEAPEVRLQAMSVDGPGKRSIEVSHRNLGALHFRAVKMDVEKKIEGSKDWSALPTADDMQKLVSSRPTQEWTVELPPTPDYETHRTFVSPPVKEPGFYVVLASARKDFGASDNIVVGTNLFVSDLVLVVRAEAETGAVLVRVLSGATGKPVSGAEVALWRFDWREGHRRDEAKTTGADGAVSFDARERGGTFHLLAKKGPHVTFDGQQVGFYRQGTPGHRTASLLYTDRSIYRPGQKLFWKVLAYEGSAESARFKSAAQVPVTVWLVDPNGEKVETRTVTTNAFGTAAGEIVVPTGRLLGGWRLESSLSGVTLVRVEEYKRPTFEVAFQEPKEPMRLNRKAVLKGEAKYYFGLPVASGEVRWRVTRETVHPWWWSFWGWGSPAKAQTVASGATTLGADGTFTVSFTPEADETVAKGSEVTWRYVANADVVDEGGETRSAARSVRLGFVSVEASVGFATGFLREAEPASVTITRTSLDGVPRPGKGQWRLVALVSPATTPRPADLPRRGGPPEGEEGAPEGAPYRTPGDALRPRWETAFQVEGVLRDFRDGAERARGEAGHGEDGVAKVDLGKLPEGAWRVRYTTVDDFGAAYETFRDFLVAGGKDAPAVPLALVVESGSVRVGETARLLAASGLPGQEMLLERFRAGKLLSRSVLTSGQGKTVVEIPVTEEDRGGFGVTLSALRDHQWMSQTAAVFVPWDDRALKLEFATFRDRIRPGTRETWRVTVKSPSGRPVEAGAAELLGYMYDRSLDVFAPHQPPSVLGLYPSRVGTPWTRATLGATSAQWVIGSFDPTPSSPSLDPDRLKALDRYGIGGPGARGRRLQMRGALAGGVVAESMAMDAAMPAPAPASAPARQMAKAAAKEEGDTRNEERKDAGGVAPAAAEPPALRSNFAETAFWTPQLLTGADGSAAIEFTVPDSVTSWNVWLHAVTKDLRGASLRRETKSVKELMVRPYVPRFLREGDRAELKVVVNNASDGELKGSLTFQVLDPETNEDLSARFGLSATDTSRAIVVPAGGGSNQTFLLTAPPGVRTVAFKVTATSGSLSDGELRPLPVLPSRMHLVQSRFVTLREGQRKELRFEDLAKGGDPTLVNEQMVVTVDAQLFYAVLEALPYLVNYPYECTEQTLNRFVSTGIVSSIFEKYPSVAAMAKEFSKRDVRLETWDAADPNRKMTLEESPWLVDARGGQDAGHGLAKVLDPRVAKAEREAAMAKLRKAQTSIGGFPWWPGGPPSPYMTVYILHGLAKASEFGVEVPKDMVQRAWAYVAKHYRDDLRDMMKKDCCWEILTFVNYVASCYPDPSWMGDALTAAERKEMLDFSFKHWKQHSPYLKGYLALTLKRVNREKDAQLVFASVMDSAKTTEDQGTFWAPEDRSWLWYNDTIETHAFALRTLTELSPKDPRRDGLVQWLFLNKKLNQWKSTRATAEVIYSLVHYLKAEGALGTRETMKVTVGGRETAFAFEPDRYTGKKNQVVIPGPQVDPKTASTITVEKGGKGFAFASAAWHFSTEKLPEEDRGDFFQVSRRYFLRENAGKEWVLKPLADGASLRPGDQVEVQISLRTKHAAEYVHLRDPRGAGFEPETTVSRYKWDLGIAWYEEVRDSGTNFFFEQLPVGEYTFKYRLRANMAGTFRVGPATVQSMYAPEFNAYSTGAVLTVKGEPSGTK
jgi:uncharacterized protein YfaS (alpha-2-macroglobulin family)